MLLLSNQFQNLQVVSLHSEQPVAQVKKAIINPNQLTVEGFYCNLQNRRSGERQVLLTQDIRQLQGNKILINSEREIVSATELVRLKKILKINYQLTGKKVKTESKKSLGKVEEYVIENTSYTVQKIYVQQSLLKSFTRSNLIIARPQIRKVTDKAIIVDDNAAEKSSALKEAAESVLGEPQVGIS